MGLAGAVVGHVDQFKHIQRGDAGHNDATNSGKLNTQGRTRTGALHVLRRFVDRGDRDCCRHRLYHLSYLDVFCALLLAEPDKHIHTEDRSERRGFKKAACGSRSSLTHFLMMIYFMNSSPGQSQAVFFFPAK